MGKQVNGDWRGPSLFLQPSPDGHPRFYFAQVALIRDSIIIIITVCLLYSCGKALLPYIQDTFLIADYSRRWK